MRDADVQPPQELGEHDGLSYALFLPATQPQGGVVVLHGADSCKESHYDYARRCRAHGLAVVAFDQRGHGASAGALDARMAHDVAAMAALLPSGPVALRGSSMGGYLALVAAEGAGAGAVVAICAASGTGMARGVREGRFGFHADAGLEAFLLDHDERAAAATIACPVLLLHAEGDESVPASHSRDLHAAREAAGLPSRLVVAPGGDHRSVQHHDELQDLSVRFLLQALR